MIFPCAEGRHAAWASRVAAIITRSVWIVISCDWVSPTRASTPYHLAHGLLDHAEYLTRLARLAGADVSAT